MRNEYRVKGDVTEIYIDRKNGERHTVLIDTEDLEKVSQFSCWTYCNGYARNFKENVRMHRVIMDVTDPRLVVDHINSNGLDNRKSNLRVCTNAENLQNANGCYRSNKSSGIRGVYKSRSTGSWIVKVKLNGKLLNICYEKNFHTAKELAFTSIALLHPHSKERIKFLNLPEDERKRLTAQLIKKIQQKRTHPNSDKETILNLINQALIS